MSTSFGLKKDKLKLLNNTKVITKKEKSIQIKFLQIMSIVIIPSLIISEFLWKNNIGVIHSILELISIFFSISLFFIVWHKYEKSPKSSRFIAFGLLATTIFDIIHIYYYEPLGLALGYGDVATKFWILGRFTEVIMIFISSFSFSTIKLNIRKEILLLVTLLLSMILSYIVIINDSKLPVLFDINVSGSENSVF
jgi:Membrane-associated sensor domain